MEKFVRLDSFMAPLNRSHVDTDQIIPKQFLRSISRSGFGPFLFDEWRYLDHGELGMDCARRPRNPDFVLNDERYAGARVLLTGENFGCGSSREHAVWALMEYGFRAVIAPSFGDIFAGNALKNGLLPVRLEEGAVAGLFALVEEGRGRVTVDLAAQTVVGADGRTLSFEVAAEAKARLLDGLDDVAMTLRQAEAIRDYEERRRREEPWVFNTIEV